MEKRLTNAPEGRRTRDKVQTAHALRLALLRVKNKGKKISISSVAAEAGVDPSLIHHVYSDLAEEIRSLAGKGTRSSRDQKHRELVEARRRISELNADIQVLLAELAMAASLNLRLEEELLELRTGVFKVA